MHGRCRAAPHRGGVESLVMFAHQNAHSLTRARRRLTKEQSNERYYGPVITAEELPSQPPTKPSPRGADRSGPPSPHPPRGKSWQAARGRERDRLPPIRAPHLAVAGDLKGVVAPMTMLTNELRAKIGRPPPGAPPPPPRKVRKPLVPMDDDEFFESLQTRQGRIEELEMQLQRVKAEHGEHSSGERRRGRQLPTSVSPSSSRRRPDATSRAGNTSQPNPDATSRGLGALPSL